MTTFRPQRLLPPSPVGSLLKGSSAASTVRTAPKDASRIDAAYLVLVRQLPCLSCGMQPCYEAAHVSLSSAAHGKMNMLGKRAKPKWVLPLCPDDHRLARDCQHSQSEQIFWDKLGIDPLATCEALWAQRGDLVAMENVIRVTIANRGKTS